MLLQRKRCPRCNAEKAASEFYADASSANGLSSRCKECDRAKGRADYARDPGRKLTKVKAYQNAKRRENPRLCACGAPLPDGIRKCDACKSAWLIVDCWHCGALISLRSQERRKSYRRHGRTFCSQVCRDLTNSAEQLERWRQRRLPVPVERTTVAVTVIPAAPRPAPRTFTAGHCAECSQPFVSTQPASRFCGDKCAKRHHRRIYKRARRAREHTTAVDRIDPRAIYIRDNWTCRLCRKPLDTTADPQSDHAPSIDHILPLSLGGTHTADNLQSAHRICNVRKGATIGQLTIGI